MPRKRLREEDEDDELQPTKKKIHEVVIEENVEDAIDDDEEILPATQLPAPSSRRRTNTAAVRQKTKIPGNSKKVAVPKRAIAKAGKPKPSPVRLTQKRKANIAASFMTSLANRGISEELKKTDR